MNKKINARTISLVLIFILILITIALLIGKFTYSYLAPTIDDDVEGAGEVTASGDTIIFTKGNTLSLSANTDNFKTGGSNLTATTNPKVKLMASSKTESASSKYFAGVIIKNNTYRYTTTDKKPEVILTVKDENGNIVESSADNLKFVTVNNNLKGFDITGVNGAFNIVTDHIIATSSNKSEVIHTWTFTLTFVNLGTDQSNNENSTLNIDVVLQKDKLLTSIADFCANGDNLNDCIVNFYNGLNTVSNIYYHDSNLTNGAKDNSYRYAGANPNNFVCFGSTASPCPTDNLYRIIGAFENQVKLIKYDYVNSNLLGTDGEYNTGTFLKSTHSTYKGELTTINIYSWNYKNDTSINGGFGSNEWSTSLFNKTNLNTNFLNNIGTTWSNLIEDTIWKVSGHTTCNVTPSAMYTAEITKATKTYGPSDGTSKIGLMYASDYGFAASPSAWTTNLRSYDSPSITSVNWMYMGLSEWTITPDSSSNDYVFNLDHNGYLGFYSANAGIGGRPVLYLKASVAYASGDGSQNLPIRLSD
ncbi:surface protein [Clostridium sp. CAG:609]|nr:surface protein [Clostridium sp. CAG:609]